MADFSNHLNYLNVPDQINFLRSLHGVQTTMGGPASAGAATAQSTFQGPRAQILNQWDRTKGSFGGAGYTDWPAIRGIAGGAGLVGYGGYQLYKLATEEMHKIEAQEANRRAMYQDPVAFDKRASESLDPVNRMNNPFHNPNDDMPPEYMKWRQGDNWDKMGGR